MRKDEILKHITDIGIVPVVRAESAAEALAVVDAIRAGGVSILEITMTVPGAVNVIAEIAHKYGNDVVVGAGTVIDSETARQCILAGAQFVVGPSLNISVIETCQQHSIAVCPGALTPTEVVTAWQAGADIVKIFPCGAVGGARYLKALKAPLPQIRMMPTGGVTLETASDFIAAGAVALGVGADLVDLKAIRNGEPEKVTRAAAAYVEAVRQARASTAAARA
ncbi:MAG: bifunctional 4-hydroxy-2-oxoglutarate aldolase/2-dehydro-3-deoxy-phosphogluconate aldolase [Pyrinomonadaceae bacterium]